MTCRTRRVMAGVLQRRQLSTAVGANVAAATGVMRPQVYQALQPPLQPPSRLRASVVQSAHLMLRMTYRMPTANRFALRASGARTVEFASARDATSARAAPHMMTTRPSVSARLGAATSIMTITAAGASARDATFAPTVGRARRRSPTTVHTSSANRSVQLSSRARTVGCASARIATFARRQLSRP